MKPLSPAMKRALIDAMADPQDILPGNTNGRTIDALDERGLIYRDNAYVMPVYRLNKAGMEAAGKLLPATEAMPEQASTEAMPEPVPPLEIPIAADVTPLILAGDDAGLQKAADAVAAMLNGSTVIDTVDGKRQNCCRCLKTVSTYRTIARTLPAMGAYPEFPQRMNFCPACAAKAPEFAGEAAQAPRRWEPIGATANTTRLDYQVRRGGRWVTMVYRLTVEQARRYAKRAGRLVDAMTGAPVLAI